MFPLFDSHGDGYLDDESVERVVDAVVVPVTAAAERCYVSAARTSLDKKAASAMPKTMKYTLLDVLEVPVKRRCAVAWAEDRKQVCGFPVVARLTSFSSAVENMSEWTEVNL